MATPKRKKPRKYGHGTITRLPNGKASAYISIAGVVNRRRFPSEPEAEAWLDAQAAHLSCELTATQIQDAAAARAILPPNVSLLQLAQAWLDAQAAVNPDVSLVPIVETYLAHQASRLRPETWRSYRIQLNRALSLIGSNVADYTRETVRRALSPLTAQAANHLLRSLRAFFNWAIAHGHLATNPCVGIKLERVQEPRRVVLTLAQTEQLLHAVHDRRPDLLGYFVLCLFAGLRPTEAQRISPEKVGDEYITLDANVTKTRSARTVPVEEGLSVVLAKYPLGLRSYTAIKRMIAECGIPWTQDIMRHSYASYAYERSRDAAATAYAMGHQGTDIFFRHYRGLVAPRDGVKYFRILANFATFLQRNA